MIGIMDQKIWLADTDPEYMRDRQKEHDPVAVGDCLF
jgi:hypothetical protein